MRVALLGTGKMGAAIARRLAAAGFDLVLWNRSLERARQVGVGRVADSAAQAASGADTVLTSLYDGPAVLDVLGSLSPEGQLFVETSTTGPEVAEQLAQRLEVGGSRLLTAPIVGSIPAIERGSALILVGGHQDAFEKARSVLEAFGQPQYMGTRRAAALMKLLNNGMLATCSLAAAELLAAGEREGLDPREVFQLLNRIMPYLQIRARSYLDRDHSSPTFELDALVKDLGLALGVGHTAGAAMPVVAQAHELYRLAAAEHGREEMTAVIELFSR